MSYLPLIIAMGIVLIFGFWSGRHRLKLKKKQKQKGSRESSSGPERLTKLRRVK